METPVMTGRMRLLDAIPAAMAHAQKMLFAPFRLEKWLQLGVIIFLASLLGMNGGAGGGNPSGLLQYRQELNGKNNQVILERMTVIAEWLQAHIIEVFALILIFVVILFAALFALMWLQARGTFMFVRAVAEDEEDLGANWRTARAPARSLFNFYLVYYSIIPVISLLALGAGAMVILSMILNGEREGMRYLAAALPFLGVATVVGLGSSVALCFLRGFVIPIMYACKVPCTAAWRIFFDVARENSISMLAFIGYRIAFSIAVGILTLFACCCTCAIGLLPVVSQTLFAPILIFDRAVPLFMLAQLGSDFDPFPREPESEIEAPSTTPISAHFDDTFFGEAR